MSLDFSPVTDDRATNRPIDSSRRSAAIDAAPACPSLFQDGLPLVEELCSRLATNDINYCHWKSNAALHLSANGDNDLDLLIDRRQATRFAEILSSLEFKAVAGATSRELPGIRHFFGYDVKSDKFVHVHAHYQLIVGHDTTKAYRLPVEDAYIRSSRHKHWFRVPQPEFELIVFVIRMVLKHCVLDSILFREGRLTSSEDAELNYLTVRATSEILERILKEHFPELSPELFQQCLHAIEPTSTVLVRWKASRLLLQALKTRCRLRRHTDAMIRVGKRLSWRTMPMILRRKARKRFLDGGRLVALVGGDGSGKSTAVAELGRWLNRHFDVTTVHMGKPGRSIATLAIGGFLSFLGRCRIVSLDGPTTDDILAGHSARPVGFAWAVSQILIARDRLRMYRRALRLASSGQVVLTDRFPLKELICMDGVKIGRVVHKQHCGKLRSWLVDMEERFYNQITPPDSIYVLRIEPHLALRRRPDENSRFVQARNLEIYHKTWATPHVKVIDSGVAKYHFLRTIKQELWRDL